MHVQSEGGSLSRVECETLRMYRMKGRFLMMYKVEGGIVRMYKMEGEALSAQSARRGLEEGRRRVTI